MLGYRRGVGGLLLQAAASQPRFDLILPGRSHETCMAQTTRGAATEYGFILGDGIGESSRPRLEKGPLGRVKEGGGTHPVLALAEADRRIKRTSSPEASPGNWGAAGNPGPVGGVVQ